MTPYKHWRLSHAIHHRGAANLGRRGVGDIHTLTVSEYCELSRWKRLIYRFYRHPLVLFGVGPFFNFVVLQRLMFTRSTRKEWRSLHWNNLAIGLVATLFILTIGLKDLVSLRRSWRWHRSRHLAVLRAAPVRTCILGDRRGGTTLAALKGSSY
jgi:omega-6 fatty acid desaturase (delta-12 desaturase)